MWAAWVRSVRHHDHKLPAISYLLAHGVQCGHRMSSEVHRENRSIDLAHRLDERPPERYNTRATHDTEIACSIDPQVCIDNTSVLLRQHRGSPNRMKDGIEVASDEVFEIFIRLHVGSWRDFADGYLAQGVGGGDLAAVLDAVDKDVDVERVREELGIYMGVVQDVPRLNVDVALRERMLRAHG